jgi:pimeloyl-ACP methyl ester carboxylesterase
MRHVSSADTARDLNVLRQDVGDPKLTYLGFSYGTVIGATYANLFPDKVRAMVLDGTLDFVGNATGHRPGDGAAFPVDVRQGVDAVYHNLAITEDQQVPGFGRLIVYDMMPCATWPAMHTDAYDGPWNRSRTPILVINAVHDPITPIWGAEAAVDELGNARLLKVNGDGHTSMFVEPSVCRDDAELAYLVSLQLPAKGTTCNVDQLPFGLSPGP